MASNTFTKVICDTDLKRGKSRMLDEFYDHFLKPHLDEDETKLIEKMQSINLPIINLDEPPSAATYAFTFCRRNHSQRSTRVENFLEDAWVNYREKQSLVIGDIIKFAWLDNHLTVKMEPRDKRDPPESSGGNDRDEAPHGGYPDGPSVDGRALPLKKRLWKALDAPLVQPVEEEFHLKMEEISLSPSQESPIKLIEGDGGSCYAWNTTIFPFLGSAQVAAAVLVLNPGGFALPHYTDCSKIGCVIQGSEGIAGIIDAATSKEKLVKLKKGDAIAVPGGGVSWWSNAGNDEVKIVFLGQSVNDLAQFTYCILTGPMGILKAFPTTTICKAFDMNQEQADVLTDSQKQPLIIKLEDTKTMQSLPKRTDTKALCYNFDEKPAHITVKNGGSYNSLTKEKYPLLQGIELSGNYLKLEPNAMFGPVYYARDSGVQLTYVVKGGGCVQVVSLTGKIVLDITIKAGQVFGVPNLYLTSIDAGDEGIECFSIVNTSKPILCQVAGETSVWKSLSPAVLQASLNISPEFYKIFTEKLDKSCIIKPGH